MKSRMRYFTYSEFDQKGLASSGEEHMDRNFLNSLDALRHKCGFPFIITSGYRSPEYNDRVSGTGLTGPHTTGRAADILVSGENTYTLLDHAFEMDCFNGIGINQKGDARFIHLDSIEGSKRIWSY